MSGIVGLQMCNIFGSEVWGNLFFGINTMVDSVTPSRYTNACASHHGSHHTVEGNPGSFDYGILPRRAHCSYFSTD